MAINKNFINLKTDLFSDEQYTPFYAVDPIVKYIPKNSVIWCPFDCDWSAYPQTLRANGYQVICTSLSEGIDFFKYEPPHYDIIISNPPFSKKDPVLERLYKLNKPFAMLLPINSLQGIKRYDFFCNGLQLLIFDKRICFHNPYSMTYTKSGVAFASAYFCKDLLPKDLIFEKLNVYSKSLV